MKKAAFEPFKFGRSKTSRQTYFPAVARPPETPLSVDKQEKALRRSSDNSTRNGRVEK